ncbi:hypothetical protein KHQ81_15680 (plasmid) [Mycoplasmatota bacterium]|nr:hypothetical protein KHQ81_15680 [Mycoplasmatota bacterium]
MNEGSLKEIVFKMMDELADMENCHYIKLSDDEWYKVNLETLEENPSVDLGEESHSVYLDLTNSQKELHYTMKFYTEQLYSPLTKDRQQILNNISFLESYMKASHINPEYLLIKHKLKHKLNGIFKNEESMKYIMKAEGLSAIEVVEKHDELLSWLENDYNNAISKKLYFKDFQADVDDGKLRISLLFNYNENLILSLETDISYDSCSVGVQDKNGYIHDSIFGEINDLDHQISLDEVINLINKVESRQESLSL